MVYQCVTWPLCLWKGFLPDGVNADGGCQNLILDRNAALVSVLVHIIHICNPKYYYHESLGARKHAYYISTHPSFVYTHVGIELLYTLKTIQGLIKATQELKLKLMGPWTYERAKI